MEVSDIKTIIDEGRLPGFSADSIYEEGELLVIDGKVPFPVLRDCSHNKNSDLDIYDENGSLMGILLGTRSINPVNIRSLTEWQLAAYLLECNYDNFDQPFLFSNDYVVIDSSRVADYREKMMVGCEVWGFYSHVDNASRPSTARQCQSLRAIQGIQMPTAFHKTSLEHAIQASHPFERYLKYYHQLELLFDWIVVKKIQALQDDLQGAARLISSYQSGDLPRLKSLIGNYCNDAREVYSLLARVTSYSATGMSIFQDYGKDGNPLKDTWSEMHTELSRGYFVSPITRRIPSDQDKYDKHLLDIAAYWIFRIRCCIAHQRIGEYLLSQNDEAFVVEFGEPLLLGVIAILLANQDLQAIR